MIYDNLGGFGVAGGGHTYDGYPIDPTGGSLSLDKLAVTKPVPLSVAPIAPSAGPVPRRQETGPSDRKK